MNTIKFPNIAKWAYFLLFQFACLTFCFISADLLVATGLFKIGREDIASFLYGAFLVVSVLSLIEYLKGIDSFPFFWLAIIASPIATVIFVMIRNQAGLSVEDWAAVFQIIFAVICSCGVAFAISISIIFIAKELERKIYPLYEKMGF